MSNDQNAGAARPRKRGGADDRDARATEAFALQQHVFYWMTQVTCSRDRQMATELRRYRLRVPEWRILALLKSEQSLSLGATAATVGLDHTTMSRTVDRMVRAGRLLRLTDTADMRVTRLSLTAGGLRLFEEVWPIVARLNREALARLPDGAAPLLCLALREIQGALEAGLRQKREKVKRKLPTGAARRGDADFDSESGEES